MKSPLQRHRRHGQRRHMHHSLSSSSRGLSLQRFCAQLWTNWLFVSAATVCMSYFDTDDTDGVETLSLLSFECLQYCLFDKCFWATTADCPSFQPKMIYSCGVTKRTQQKNIKLSEFFFIWFFIIKRNNTAIALFCKLKWAQPRSSLRLYARFSRELNVNYLLNLSIFPSPLEAHT